jgi:hypothetical protein
LRSTRAAAVLSGRPSYPQLVPTNDSMPGKKDKKADRAKKSGAGKDGGGHGDMASMFGFGLGGGGKVHAAHSSAPGMHGYGALRAPLALDPEQQLVIRS